MNNVAGRDGMGVGGGAGGHMGMDIFSFVLTETI